MITCAGLALLGTAEAQEDPGKSKIGRVCVTVYHATNGEPQAAATKAPVTQEMADRLSKEKQLRFKHYQLLGQDTQALLRSYESWAQPLKPSDEVLVRFEAKGPPTKKSLILDLELWLGRKKIVKTDALLEGKRPLFVLGPEWRGGRLIIAVALAPDHKPDL
jgi:hypothetical protein